MAGNKNPGRVGVMLIAGREVGNFRNPYIIAELGANHNGDRALAKKLIDAAKKAGCDCVKFQSWTKDTIFSRGVYENNYFLKDDYRSRKDYTLEQIVEAFSMTEEKLREVHAYCQKIGMAMTSTPFSKREVDFLVKELKVPFLKIASMDLNHTTLIAYAASSGLPIVLSTGFGTLQEIKEAVQSSEGAGNRNIVILHCVSAYPPPDDEVHLNNIETLQNLFPDYPIGFSDHTLGIPIALAAVAKGASMIEKHFTLDKNMFGWDHKISATPEEMTALVEGARRIPKALGSKDRIRGEGEKERMSAYRRSVVAAKKIPKGKALEEKDLDFKRPGTGISPNRYQELLGKRVKKDIEFDRLIFLEDLE